MAGDLNVVANQRDVYRLLPENDKDDAHFFPSISKWERDNFVKLKRDCRLDDVYDDQNKCTTNSLRSKGLTWHRNKYDVKSDKGMRIDYFLVDESLTQATKRFAMRCGQMVVHNEER